MISKFKKNLTKYFQEVLEIKTSPHSIAAGFALGTLIAILPTFGLGVFIGLFFVFLFKRISKISLLLAFLVWNPIVLALIYPLAYVVGNFILGETPIKLYNLEILNQLFVYSRRFLIGSLVNALVISMISYVITLILILKYQKKKIKSFSGEIDKLEGTMKI